MKNILKKLENPYKDFHKSTDIKLALIKKPLYRMVDSIVIYNQENQLLFNIKGSITLNKQKYDIYINNKKIQTIKENRTHDSYFLEGTINGILHWSGWGKMITNFNDWYVGKHKKVYYILSKNNIIAEIETEKGNNPYYEKEARFIIKYSNEEDILTIMLFAIAIVLHATPSKNQQIDQIKVEKGWYAGG